MSIRVAYDILFLANFFEYPSGQSGVYRAVQGLLFELCRRDDIELTTIAVCGQNPLVDVGQAAHYIAEQANLGDCKFDPALTGRFGLSSLYLRNRSHGWPGGFTSRSNTKKSAEAAQSMFTRTIRRIDQPKHNFARGRYDVLHSPFYPLPGRDIIGDVPRVQTVFDLICQRHPEWMPADVISLAGQIFAGIDTERDRVTCISEFTKAEFCEFTGMTSDRVFVTPLAAADHFRPVSDSDVIRAARSKYAIPDNDYFLALGALQPRKNFTHLVRSFSHLLSEQPELTANLVIIGTNPWLYDEIFALLETAPDLRRRIIFTGFVSDEDLSAIYSGATAFVFPSLYEGFGLPPLEAMQCGTPVIASNTTALPEVIGDAGLLIDPTDSDALCQAMLEVITSPPLRAELSQKGLRQCRKFTWAKCAEKTVEAYRSAAT